MQLRTCGQLLQQPRLAATLGRMTRRQPLPLPLHMQLAPFAVAHADAVGVSRRRLRASDLTAPFYGVRAPAGHMHEHARGAGERGLRGEARVAALCLAYAQRMPDTHAFSDATAATLWGLPLPARLQLASEIHVTAWGASGRPRCRGVVGHHLSERPAVERLGGHLVTDAASTWCALATVLSLDELVEAGDRLVGRPEPLVLFEQIDRAIAKHGGRRGARRLREARALLRANSESPRETRVRLLLLRAGLPEPQPNGEIRLRSGRVTHGDLVFRHYKVLVEYDGDHHRTDSAQWVRDVHRLNDLADAGWHVIRINKATPTAEIVARTERALRDRGWNP